MVRLGSVIGEKSGFILDGASIIIFHDLCCICGKHDNKAALYEKLGFTQEYVDSLESAPNDMAIQSSNSVKSNKDIKKAIELGFTAQEITDFTDTTWNYIADIEDKTDLVSVEEKYIEITADGQARETSKEDALKDVKLFVDESEVGQDTEETSWMRVLTTVSRRVNPFSPYGPIYYIKHSFEWLTEPFWNLEDAIAISHPEYMTPFQSSELFIYNYDIHTNDILQRYVGTEEEYKVTADNKTANGMAFKFDLKNRYYNKDTGIDYVVKKNRGYMIYGTIRASDQYKTGAAYGHYAHTEIAITGSIGVKVSLNNLSVSGAAKVTNMTDTGVTFTYQE